MVSAMALLFLDYDNRGRYGSCGHLDYAAAELGALAPPLQVFSSSLNEGRTSEGMDRLPNSTERIGAMPFANAINATRRKL